MAVRQYIGARYVPRFTGLYDVTRIYDALDVVDNGSGTSYIAKKTTPAGTPLTNTDYWFVYGASSGAIINLQNQINDMKDGDVSGSLQQQIDITNEKKITEYPNRHWLFMGDSYDTLHPGYSWIDGVAGYLGIDSDHYEKRSAGGRGFYPTVPANTWLNYLIDNPVADNNAITDIVICGGANDVNAPEADLINGMQAFDQYVKSTFPNLRHVYLGFIGWQQTATNRNKMIYRAGYYRKNGVRLGWRYLNGVENIMKNCQLIDTAYTDYQHPTTAGVSELAIGIADALMTGTCESYTEFNSEYTPNATNITMSVGVTLRIFEEIRNGIISGFWGNMGMVANQNLSGDVVIGTCAPNQNAMNIGVFYNVWVKTGSEYHQAFLYWGNVGELHLWLEDGLTVASGSGLRIVAGQLSDIISR